MSQHDDDFDVFLRRVLHEEANAVEPGGDGLERIQARLTRPRPAPVAWVMAVFSGTWHRVLGAARSASARLQTLPGAEQVLRWQQALPGVAQVRRLRWPRGDRTRSWRSPAVLTAAAAVAVAAGVLALTPLPHAALSGTAGLFRVIEGGHGGGTAGHGGGQAEGSSGTQPGPAPASSSPAGNRAHPSASPSPSATRSRAATPAPTSPSAPASPTPTPSSGASPCPSASASPTPTPTPSPSPSPCPSVSPSGSPASPAPAPDPGA
jgi:hypothetical protein